MARKDCKTCKKNKRRKKRRSPSIGKLSTGAVLAGVVLLGGIGAVLYFKYNKLDKKIIVDGVDIHGIEGGKLKLFVRLVNLSSVSVNLSGVSGNMVVNGDIALGSFLSKEEVTIPTHGEISLPVFISPNPLALIGLGLDLWNSIKKNDWSGYSFDMNGDIFVGDLTLPFAKSF